MKPVNLIPASRREAKALRRRLRLWAGVLAIYGPLAVAGYAACWVFAGGGREADPHRQAVGKLSADIQAAGREVRRTRAQIDQGLLKLRAQRAVVRHPDWSFLLAALGAAVGDEVVLERCTLSPLDAAGARGSDAPPPRARSPAAAPEPGYRLDVVGIARSAPAVSRYVLRLENTRLFDRVRLAKTSRQPFLDAEAVGFHLECVLGAPGGPGQ